ncbi:hypothetical protein CCD87_03650 [Neisseria meningitidis]|nr:hypothetical protein CCD87_03650 [Neisseria meningitidis]
MIFPNSFFNQLFSESEISAWSIFAAIKARDLCKIPFPPDSRNPNTGFRLFSAVFAPNTPLILPGYPIIRHPGCFLGGSGRT